MKKTLILLILMLLVRVLPALGYEIVVVKGGPLPDAQVVSAFAEELVKILPARGPKTIEPHHIEEINLGTDLSGESAAARIAALRPDLILALGREALLSVRDIRSIPVIYLLVAAPELIVEERTNITGIRLDIPPKLQFDQVSRYLPKVKRVGVIFDPARSSHVVNQAALNRPDLEFVALAASSAREVPGLLEKLKGKVDLLWLLPDLTVTNPQTLQSYFLFSFQNKTPVLAFSEKYLKNGAALAVTFDLEDMGVQAARLAAAIFTGTPAGRLSVRDISAVKTAINHDITEKLGLDLAPGAP
ncbi:MAG: hypothetical protein HY885_14505 [Deltaproteobacteria bacterium]|nr:hypothetical protein [Deltaproteobacteria bacterium]